MKNNKSHMNIVIDMMKIFILSCLGQLCQDFYACAATIFGSWNVDYNMAVMGESLRD